MDGWIDRQTDRQIERSFPSSPISVLNTVLIQSLVYYKLQCTKHLNILLELSESNIKMHTMDLSLDVSKGKEAIMGSKRQLSC